jgi:hypothetical protein
MSHSVPKSLVFEQATMLRAMGRIVMQSVLPFRRPRENPPTIAPAHMTLKAPSDRLVDHYLDWSGAPASRYRNELPPHLFAHWGLAAVSRILEQTRYPMAGALNQGCSVTVNGAIPRGAELQVEARLQSIEESDGRARVAVEIASGTAEQPEAVLAVFHIVFITGKRGGKKDEARAEPQWETVGQWRAADDDGLQFALLTGDFNPIHWIGIAGKLSPFKRKVLHGFGSFVRSWEALANAGHPVREIDVRFRRPVPLPSGELSVQHAPPQDGWRPLRLADGAGSVHMAGRYRG